MSEIIVGKRGRKAIEVTPVELAEIIGTMESEQPEGKFPNRSALWAAIEASEWAKSRSPRPLSSQTAMIMAQKSNINIATPVGKRGREKGSGMPTVNSQKKRNGIDGDTVMIMKRAIPESMHAVIDRAAKGSFKAAIKLKCFDCCNGQKKEVALCAAVDCSLHSFRPYKATANELKRIALGTIND